MNASCGLLRNKQQSLGVQLLAREERLTSLSRSSLSRNRPSFQSSARVVLPSCTSWKVASESFNFAHLPFTSLLLTPLTCNKKVYLTLRSVCRLQLVEHEASPDYKACRCRTSKDSRTDRSCSCMGPWWSSALQIDQITGNLECCWVSKSDKLSENDSENSFAWMLRWQKISRFILVIRLAVQS